jgi:threonine/homoserine/homoserine lactone efflux protein
MLGIHDYWLFVATGVLLNLTPGQDTFFILGRSIAEGPKSGIASALGIAVGSLLHTAFAAVGLSAVLATSAFAFTVVKVLGAAYLIYLGVRMLFTASVEAPATSRHAVATGTRRAFRDGIVSNVLNPKVALFFLALMPQFIAPESDTKVAAFIALGLTFVTTGTVWCLVLAIAAGKLRGFLARHPQRWGAVTRASGGLFVLLGLRLAVSRQS